ncbi:dockerin type I domain-containing protein [Mucisphaera calidilacus]|uniref:dockerin type I domain-containing protein n=1 Tax=Mucisphaera calidilacus TaxID=2527982 RepID=UPI00119F995D|nr:dockerin type I domain-containing protein [Mucisphaera calidilacus]
MALAFSVPAQAGLLYSFEDVAVGEMLNGDGVIVDTGSGITDGVQALRLAGSAGGYDKLGHIVLNDLVDTSVDITTFQADWAFDAVPGSAGGYNGLTLAMYNQTTATFRQIGGGGSDSNTVGEYIGSSSSTTTTVSYNLGPNDQAFLNSGLDAGDPIELGFYSNKAIGVVGDYTIDNLQFNGSLVGGPGQPVLLGSFEDATPGDQLGGTGFVVDSGPGITEGLQALRGTLTADNSYQKIGEISLPTPTNDVYSSFSVDWYHEFAGFSFGYLELIAAIFTEDGGFTQLSGAKTVGNPDAFIGFEDSQFTVEYELTEAQAAQLSAAQSVGLGATIEFFANKATDRGGILTVDNVIATLEEVDLIEGDINGDGSVDLLDLSILATNFQGTDTPYAREEGDLTGDGLVDLLDLSVLASNFNATAVPEPAGLALLGLTGVLISQRRNGIGA